MTTKLYVQTVQPNTDNSTNKHIYFLERATYKTLTSDAASAKLFKPWPFSGTELLINLSKAYSEGHRFIINFAAKSRLDPTMTSFVLDHPMITVVKKFNNNTPHQVTSALEGYTFRSLEEKHVSREELMAMLSITELEIPEPEELAVDDIPDDIVESSVPMLASPIAPLSSDLSWADQVTAENSDNMEPVTVKSVDIPKLEDSLGEPDDDLTSMASKESTASVNLAPVVRSVDAPDAKEIERKPIQATEAQPLPQRTSKTADKVEQKVAPAFSSFASPHIRTGRPAPKQARPVEDFYRAIFMSLFASWYRLMQDVIALGKPLYILPGSFEWNDAVELSQSKIRYRTSTNGNAVLGVMTSIEGALQPNEFVDRKQLIQEALAAAIGDDPVHVIVGLDTIGVLRIG
uniref:Uncharacterized protein n=1 Tax=Operophtera brumata cypovirus 18 TaxID=352244 RepID=Q30C72_9REOV|nr:unknown [Operophtera brumata cypovirus 18]